MYNFFTTNLRYKFIFFLLLLLFFAIWGFLYNLDGMMLILLITELTVFLLFLMTYTQLYHNYTFVSKKSYNFMYVGIFLLLLVWLIETPHSCLFYISYYNSLSTVVAADFFIIYYLLFDKLPLITTFLVLIIGLFSLFFILIYFNLKIIKAQHTKTLSSYHFLRKQNLVKQTNFKSNLYTFQN